ncbi:MAG: DUF3127 domain-containing protein [SAR324 cluster bacterium]|nr:DUF3127 domain-containing protein [SAR324 cluster bacterium]
MNIKAKLLEIFDITPVSASFKKREFVVEYSENPQYPQYLKFELIQDKCDLLDKFSVDQEIDVHFNLQGRKWTDPQGNIKYFNTLQAWRILSADQQAARVDSDTGLDGPPAWLDEEESENDVPF